MTKQELLIAKINWIKEEIGMMQVIRPGSLSKQYNVCGKRDCACKDKNEPKKHGPYHILSYRHRGKNHTEYINKKFIEDTKEWVDDYKKLQKLVDQWIDYSLALSKLMMKDSLEGESVKNS